MRLRHLTAVLLAPAALAACAAGGRGRANAGQAGQTAILEVRNEYLGPVDLYAIRDGGYVRRIGSAYTSRVERFRLGPDLVNSGGAVRIIAVPLAENGRASTGQLVLRPGETVQFNIASNLQASTTFIR